MSKLVDMAKFFEWMSKYLLNLQSFLVFLEDNLVGVLEKPSSCFTPKIVFEQCSAVLTVEKMLGYHNLLPFELETTLFLLCLSCVGL